MKKTYEKIDLICTLIMIALGAVMLLTHTWIFGIFGAAYCIWQAFFADGERKRARIRRVRSRSARVGCKASSRPAAEVRTAKIIELPYVG